MKKLYLLIILPALTASALWAQAPNLQKAVSIGGSQNDFGADIHQTTDSGYIVAGQTKSNIGNLTGAYGNEDFLIVKLNKNLTIKWLKAFGGIGDEKAIQRYSRHKRWRYIARRPRQFFKRAG
jgi:hypothetical protein